jgi:ubiquinone/menaquinone biosynthesis C-methylase UbiE
MASTLLWDLYAACYDALWGLIPYQTLQHSIVADARPAPGERMLIAGCGTGVLEWLISAEQPDVRIVALDASGSMLKRARAKCAGRPQVTHQQADLCAPLPFPDASFDVAVMCNVLYALPDGEAALREISRVVRPGGRFVLCDRQPISHYGGVGRAHRAAINALSPGKRLGPWLRTIAAVPALCGVAIANILIDRLYNKGEYHFYSEEAITTLLHQLNFMPQSFASAYADQCWLLHAVRQPVALEDEREPCLLSSPSC